MAINLGINGFGRVGRTVLRNASAAGAGVRVVGIRSDTDAATMVHLLRYDSGPGRFRASIESDGNTLIVAGRRIPVFGTDAHGPVWSERGAEVVLDCSSERSSVEQAREHLERGAPRVLLASPTAGVDATVVLGVNDDVLQSDDRLVSAATPATNCMAAVLQVLHSQFGVESAMATQLHAHRSDEAEPAETHRESLRARAATTSLVPTPTSDARVLGEVLPDLARRVNAMAVRAPVSEGSLVDITARLETDVDVEAIADAFVRASTNGLSGVIETTRDPIVGMDVVGSEASAMVDLGCTQVIGARMIRVMAWYDAETGYAARCLDLVRSLARMRAPASARAA